MVKWRFFHGNIISCWIFDCHVWLTISKHLRKASCEGCTVLDLLDVWLTFTEIETRYTGSQKWNSCLVSLLGPHQIFWWRLTPMHMLSYVNMYIYIYNIGFPKSWGYLQLIHFVWGTFHQKNIQLLGYLPFMETPSRNLLRAVEVPKLCDYLGPFEAFRRREDTRNKANCVSSKPGTLTLCGKDIYI